MTTSITTAKNAPLSRIMKCKVPGFNGALSLGKIMSLLEANTHWSTQR